MNNQNIGKINKSILLIKEMDGNTEMDNLEGVEADEIMKVMKVTAAVAATEDVEYVEGVGVEDVEGVGGEGVGGEGVGVGGEDVDGEDVGGEDVGGENMETTQVIDRKIKPEITKILEELSISSKLEIHVDNSYKGNNDLIQDGELPFLLKSAIFQLEQELLDLYTVPDEENLTISDSDIEMSQENAEHVRKLIEQHLSPIILSALANTFQLRLQTMNLKSKKIVRKEIRKKNSWSIFLSEIAKNLPGWKETNSKLTFASMQYKKFNKEEKEQIVINYYKSHNMPIPGRSTQKVQRISGLDAFRKFWYQERKKNDPSAKGIDSKCSKDWATLNENEKAKWKEIRRQQIAEMTQA